MNNFISYFQRCFVFCLPVLFVGLFAFPVDAQWVNSSVGGNIVNAKNFLETPSGKVFAVTNLGILVSSNFGDSWSYASYGIINEQNVNCVEGNDSLLFAGCYMDGLFRSTNGGMNWVNVQINTQYYNNVPCVLVKGNVVFAGSGYGLYKSTNAGINWSLCFEGLNNYRLMTDIVQHNQFIIALGKAGSMGKLYRSSNDGVTWDSVNVGISLFGLEYLESCNNNVYLAGVQGFCASTNNGENFCFYAGGCGVWFNFLTNSHNYITSGMFGIGMVVPSCGLYFTQYGNGLQEKNVYDLIVSYPNYLAATDKGFYKSTNAGASWFLTFNGYFTNKYLGVGTYGNHVLTSNSSSGKVFKKEQGLQWMTTNGSFGMNKPHRYSYNMNNMFAFSEDVVIRSLLSTYGYWTAVTIPSLTPKRFDACDNYITASNASKVVYKSTNDGNNWTVLPSSGLPANFSSVHSLTITQSSALLMGVVTANGGYELYKLAYNGSAWSKVTTEAGLKTDVIRNLSGNLYAATGSSVFTSTNDGVNWFANGQGVPNDTVSDFAFVNNQIFCATKNSGVYRFSTQSNAWTVYNAGLGNLKVNALSGYFANLYAATDSGLYYADVNTSIVSGSDVPASFRLEQNYPNPFNPRTVINYSLSFVSDVLLKVYDVGGKEIQTLVNKRLRPGDYEAIFDGSLLPSGVYFYRLRAGDFVDTKRMVILK